MIIVSSDVPICSEEHKALSFGSNKRRHKKELTVEIRADLTVRLLLSFLGQQPVWGLEDKILGRGENGYIDADFRVDCDSCQRILIETDDGINQSKVGGRIKLGMNPIHEMNTDSHGIFAISFVSLHRFGYLE